MQAACQVTAFARDSRGDGHAYAWQLLGTSHGSTLRPLAVEVSSCLACISMCISSFLLSPVASLDAQSVERRAVKPVCAVLCLDARSELSAELSSAPDLLASPCASVRASVTFLCMGSYSALR